MASEPEMIGAAMTGDPEALDALWRASAGWVGAIVLAHLPAEAELEDVLQEVAVAMVSQIHTLREPDAFAPWLRSIALNVARNAGRKAMRRRRRGGGAGQLAGPFDRSHSLEMADRSPGGAGDPSDTADMPDSAARQELRAALELVHGLPEHAREVLLLRAVRGLSQAQIAAVLSVPVKTVETRLRRARQALRRMHEESEGTESQDRPARAGSSDRAVKSPLRNES